MERLDATGTTAYAYDTQNRLTEERLPAGRVNAYSYDASGNLASITDATGTVSYSYNDLCNMGARYYQPELGRWTQVDPSGLDANAYDYVGGNPVNFVDPSGRCFAGVFGEGCDIAAVVSQFLSGAIATAVAGAACSATLGLGCVAAAVGGAAAQAIVSYAACSPTEEASVADLLDYYRSDPEKLYTPGC